MAATKLEKTKLFLELLAFGVGALFLLIKLWGGQANAGMDISLELKREAVPIGDMDNLYILLKLKRNDVGRLELKDVTFDVSDAFSPNANPTTVRLDNVLKNRSLGKADDGTNRISTQPDEYMALPPEDATQLAGLVRVKKGMTILVDATVLAQRSGLWWRKPPQWRASAISLATDTSANASSAK